MGNTNATYDKMREELAKYKAYDEWLSGKLFLLESKVDSKTAYEFIRKYPESAQFLYRKYSDLRPIFRELCDPTNPLHLKDVAENLKGILDAETVKDDISKLRDQVRSLSKERDQLSEEIGKLSKEYDENEEVLERIKREVDDIERFRTNIRSDKGQEKISEILKQVSDIASEIGKEKTNVIDQTIKIDRVQANNILLVGQMAKELQEQLQTQEFLTPDSLDELHRKLLEQEKREMEDAQNSMKAIRATNPKKILKTSIDTLINVQNRVNSGNTIRDGSVYLDTFSLSIVNGGLTETTDSLIRLNKQVENTERRKVK